MTRAEAAAYYGLSASTFSGWVAAGRLPGPLPGTRRWDRKAIDASLDKLSGIVAASTPVESPLAQWKRQRAAEEAAEDKWLPDYDARKAAERAAK
jgi:hypothetical protein